MAAEPTMDVRVTVSVDDTVVQSHASSTAASPEALSISTPTNCAPLSNSAF